MIRSKTEEQNENYIPFDYARAEQYLLLATELNRLFPDGNVPWRSSVLGSATGRLGESLPALQLPPVRADVPVQHPGDVYPMQGDPGVLREQDAADDRAEAEAVHSDVQRTGERLIGSILAGGESEAIHPDVDRSRIRWVPASKLASSVVERPPEHGDGE